MDPAICLVTFDWSIGFRNEISLFLGTCMCQSGVLLNVSNVPGTSNLPESPLVSTVLSTNMDCS